MKKLLFSIPIRILFAAAVPIALAKLSVGAEERDARVTQVVRDVRLLASRAAPRPASVNDNVHEGTAVRTGSDSRAELTFTDLTLTRLGANTVFSFGGRARDFDLASGAILLSVPKGSGPARVSTGAVTAGITGFTAMAEYHAKSWMKLIILEGEGDIWLNKHPGNKQHLHAGQMIIIPPGATTVPAVQNIDLSKLIKTALLITEFPKLSEWGLILAEVDNQQTSPPSGGLIDPTSHDTIDQADAARARRPPPPPMPTRSRGG